MANPSLQIGNSNWAIKKDNLLGYSTAGTRFLPIPITMTRASAGTRVNPQGLVETVELLGSEDVVNGDFATDSDWTKGGLATISSGEANFIDAGSNTYSYIRQNISQTSGKNYILEFEVKNYVSGAVQVLLQGVSSVGSYNSNGIYSVVILSGTTNGYVELSRSYSGGTFSFSIDNVSVKEYQANDLARVDYTGSTSSLLAEPQRTNKVTYSSDFSDSSYVKSGVTVISDYATSPDGTLNASKLTFTSTGEILQSMSFVVGEQYTFSFYAKTETGTFDFTLGNMAYYLESATATTEWQRFTVTQSAVATTRYPKIDASTSGDLLVWGWQIEEGSYATSYIPTSGSTVTRVKDQYSKTGISDKIGQTEGSIYFEFKQNQLQSYTQRILTLYSDSANLIEIQLTSSNELVFVSVKTGESAVVITKSSAITLGSVTKISAGYKAGDFVFYVNGVQAGTDTDSSKTIPQMDNLLFSRYNSTAPFIGSINSLKLYKTRLTNTQLEELTT